MKILGLIFFLSACSSMKALNYKETNTYPESPKNKALVYILRSDHFSGGAINYKIYATTKQGQTVIGSLSSGSYFYKELEADEYTFARSDMWSGPKDLLKIGLKKDETTYLLVSQKASGSYSTTQVYNIKTFSPEIVMLKPEVAKQLLPGLREVIVTP